MDEKEFNHIQLFFTNGSIVCNTVSIANIVAATLGFSKVTLFRRISEFGLRTKTGIMLGLGETEEDILEAMDDLVANGVHILTLGQYLQPTKNHHPVVDWIHPDQFAKYKEIGLAKGLRYVESGPLVRSSYHAEKHLFDF